MAGQKRTDSRGRILKDGESQRKDGLYRYRYTDIDGTRHDVYSSRLVQTDRLPAGSKEDLSLREKERMIRRDLYDGVHVGLVNQMTLNDLCDMYMENKQRLSVGTEELYQGLIENHIRNSIGRQRITDIKYSTIKNFYTDLITEKNLSCGTVEQVDSILRPAFALAVRDERIRSNPVIGVLSDIKKELGTTKKKVIALTKPEQNELLRFFHTSKKFQRYENFVIFMLGTGCRIGEAAGLRWEDCDFDEGIISVNHQLTSIGNTFRGRYITKPKTRSGVREIPMLSQVRDALLAEYEFQQEFGFTTGEVDGYTGFIFQSTRCNTISRCTVNDMLHRAIQCHNDEELELASKEGRKPLLIPIVSTHSLRHTFCTRLCENETNLKVIQDIMGHSNIQTTMNVYADVTREKKQKSMVSLEGKIL